MMRQRLILLVLLILSACSEEATDSVTSDVPDKTVIDHQLKSMQKARDVEAQLLEAAQKQRAHIDTQTQ